MRNRRRVAMAVGATVGMIVAVCLPGKSASAASPGMVVDSGSRLPNFAVASYHGDVNDYAGFIALTDLVADDANGLIFAYNPSPGGSGCPNVVSYSLDTLTPLASGCVGFQTIAQTGHSPALNVAVDSRDHLLIWLSSSRNTLAVISEDTLQQLGTIVLPSTQASAESLAESVSWLPGSDDLLVVASLGNAQGGPGVPPSVWLHRYHMAPTASSPSTGNWGSPEWDLSMPPNTCSHSLGTYYATSAAQLSGDGTAVFVPCVAGGLGELGQSQAHTGVAKVTLGSTDLNGAPCAGTSLCPHSIAVAAVPGPGTVGDFVFDIPSGRGLMFDYNSTNGVTAYVYDGAGSGSFIDRTNLGTGAGAVDYTRLGIDNEAGRLYAINSNNGLTLLDDRRTPVGSGIALPEFAAPIGYGDLLVVPAGPHHPFPRIFVPYTTHTVAFRDWTILEDHQPVTSDPPSSIIDENTHPGALSPGAQIVTRFSAAARGYGVHDVFVGSYGSSIDNIADGVRYADGLPLGTTTPDIYAADVAGASIRSSVASGLASPLAADSTTSNVYNECTDARQAIGSCVNPKAPLTAANLPQPSCSPAPPDLGPPFSPLAQCQPPCPQVTSLPTAMPSAAATTLNTCGPPGTSQPWPFGNANCSQPFGQPSSGSPDSFVDGETVRAPDGTQVQLTPGSQVPDPVAHSEVHCDAASPQPQSVQASAYLHAMNVAQLASVTVGDASTMAWVAPPFAKDGTTASTTARTTAIHIDVPATSTTPSITLDIGSVSQVASATAAGTPGSATASRQVSISDLTLTAGGKQETCNSLAESAGGAGDPPPSDGCTALFDELNSQFGSVMRIEEPQPDQSFGTVRADGTIPGSPGGYTAMVQSTKEDQDHDAQFNEMRQPGEASLLPALRITIYDDGAQLNREILDLAGAEDDAELGIQVLPSWENQLPSEFVPPSSTTALEQGLLAYGSSGQAKGPIGGPETAPTASGPLAVLQQVFTGLEWLRRSPAAVVQMLTTLWLLLMPVLIMRRRWSSVRSTRRG